MLEEAHELAFRKAAGTLKDRSLEKICSRTGAELRGDVVRIGYFNAVHDIVLPECAFMPDELGLHEKILILHYLLSEGSERREWEYVTYQGLPGGEFYYPVYRKRGPARLLPVFGGNPDLIVAASRAIGGTPFSMGDAAVKLQVLPKVEALVVLHEGDEEFPPEAKILYRDDIVEFFSLEDVAFLAGVIAARLIKGHANLQQEKSS